MSLFGKILTVLNVLAAVAFFFLATVDWAKRQAWADAVAQHDLAIAGLPVDDNDLDAEGRNRLADLREGAVKNLFSKVGGNPPKPATQMAELNQLKQQVEQRVTAEEGKSEQKWARVLLPLAKTDAERQELLARMAKPTGKDDDLKERFEKAFADARTPPPAQEGKFQDSKREQKRRAIAELMFALTESLRDDENLPAEAGLGDSRAYERFRAVVGMEAARRAVDTHCQALEAITNTIRQDLINDRINFDVAFADQLRQIHAESLRVARQKDTLRLEAEKAARHAELADLRQMEVDKVKKELEAAQGVTKEKLAKQLKLEKDLFDARTKQRDTFDDNQRLEKKIRSLEQSVR